MAYVQITYQDGSYNFSTTQQLLPGGAPAKVHIPVLNRSNMIYQYSVTMLGVSGQQVQNGPTTTSNTILLINPNSGATPSPAAATNPSSAASSTITGSN
jgi:hypothetical protein